MWTKQGRVQGGQAVAASTQAEVGDDSVVAAGAEVGEVSPEVEKPAEVFVSWIFDPFAFVCNCRQLRKELRRPI